MEDKIKSVADDKFDILKFIQSVPDNLSSRLQELNRKPNDLTPEEIHTLKELKKQLPLDIFAASLDSRVFDYDLQNNSESYRLAVAHDSELRKICLNIIEWSA